MGKFISKITPTINSGQSLEASNRKVSRKVLYRRLQSPRLYQERQYSPLSDLVRNVWGVVFMSVFIYILHLRGTLDDYLPSFNEDKPYILERSLYEKVRDHYLNQNKNVDGEDENR